MLLISWHPDLARQSGDLGDVSFGLKLSVECVVCRRVYRINTERQRPGAAPSCISISEIIDREMQDALTPRACPDCGVVQTFSLQVKERLRKEIEALLTIDWVQAQSQRRVA
jgi:hypothetical protein